MMFSNEIQLVQYISVTLTNNVYPRTCLKSIHSRSSDAVYKPAKSAALDSVFRTRGIFMSCFFFPVIGDYLV